MLTHLAHTVIWKTFHLFAVYPLPNSYVTTTSRRAHHFWLVWRTLMLTISGLLIVYTYWRRESILYFADVVGQINDTLQYISLALACLVVVGENFRKQSCHVKIWKIVGRIQKLGQLTLVDQELNRRFAIIFWVCVAIFIGVQVRILTHILDIDGDQWFQIWCVNLLPLTICYLMVLVHIYYLNLLASYIQHLQQELKDVVAFTRYSMYVKIDRVVIARRLDTLKDVYGMLYQASGNVNDIFTWPQAFYLTRMFLQCTCDLHWFYKKNEHNVLLLMCRLVPQTVCFLLLLHYASLCVERAKSLAPLLFQIKFTDGERALRRMVHQFSAQLGHEPISFGGMDLYTINYGLLRIMIAGIATYIIIFIQMTPNPT